MAKSPYADVPEPLKSHLPAMFASYPSLCVSTPSSWVVWNKDTSRAYSSIVCHSKMRYETLNFDELVTAVPNNAEVALEYLRMLIRGPFRSMSDLIKLDRVGTNYYLHCLHLDKWPANVLMNFCIASRVPIEFKHMLEPWAKYCGAGYDPVLAFLLVYSYGDDTIYKVRNFGQCRGGHLWLDPSSSWLNVLNGTMEAKSSSYKTNPSQSLPTNKIWGHSKDYTTLMTMTDEQIAEFYNVPIQVYEKPAPTKKALFNKIPPYGQHVGVLLQNPAVEVMQGAPLNGWGEVAAQLLDAAPHIPLPIPMHWEVKPAPNIQQIMDDLENEPEDNEPQWAEDDD